MEKGDKPLATTCLRLANAFGAQRDDLLGIFRRHKTGAGQDDGISREQAVLDVVG